MQSKEGKQGKMKSLLQNLINEAVKDELEFLSEAGTDRSVPGKDRPWQEGDPTTIEELEDIFKWFHLSSVQLGEEDYYKFTPRLPSEPWTPIEDDFTKRISLAPSIRSAVKALDGTWREHIYAADIKGYSGDNIKTIDLVDAFNDCPQSPGNNYGPNFSLPKWIQHLEKTNQLSPSEKANKHVQVYWGLEGPKNLPKRLRDEFEACVPDANKTKEVWVTEPEVFIRVATRKIPYIDQWSAIQSLGLSSKEARQPENKIAIATEMQRLKNMRSKDNLYLTAAGAKVFNAFHSDADTIPYHR